MIKYEDYLTICFTLAASVEPTNFNRSEMGYNPRQSRGVRGSVTSSIRLVCDYTEMIQFKLLWDALLNGSQPFLTDMEIHGNKTAGKTVRFTSGYKLQPLGNSSYVVTTSLEVLRS